MRHTPGPWSFVQDLGEPYWSVDMIAGSAHAGHAMVYTSEADARLIAAAPDLLAAARLAHQELIDMGQGSSGSPALVALWAAIAKAEGREG